MQDQCATLERAFYLQEDVVSVARQLIGKVLITNFDGVRTAGIITETEAYAGVHDRASHAFGGKRTPRNEPMYARGGTIYVYRCYGIHHLFNVVTNSVDVPHAVLIRAVHPVVGIAEMTARRAPMPCTTRGPGTMSQALGIRTEHTGGDLLHGPISICDAGMVLPEGSITAGPRIGVNYAGTDALLPYRFHIAPSRLEKHLRT